VNYTPEERRAHRRLSRAEGKRSVEWVHGGLKHHKYRKLAQVIDREAVMPAARLFSAGVISRAEMLARITPR
jgi:hypothetical protein